MSTLQVHYTLHTIAYMYIYNSYASSYVYVCSYIRQGISYFYTIYSFRTPLVLLLLYNTAAQTCGVLSAPLPLLSLVLTHTYCVYALFVVTLTHTQLVVCT
jgi:hypothetical protein